MAVLKRSKPGTKCYWQEKLDRDLLVMAQQPTVTLVNLLYEMMFALPLCSF